MKCLTNAIFYKEFEKLGINKFTNDLITLTQFGEKFNIPFNVAKPGYECKPPVQKVFTPQFQTITFKGKETKNNIDLSQFTSLEKIC